MAKKLDINLDEIYQLALKGYTTSMITSAIGINRTTAYKNRSIIDIIKKGREACKQSVVDKLMSRSNEDTTALIFLAKQLKIFEQPFTTAKPTSIATATKRITEIFQSVASGELDEDKGNKLVHFLEIFIKAYETSELEDRLSKLEGVINET